MTDLLTRLRSAAAEEVFALVIDEDDARRLLAVIGAAGVVTPRGLLADQFRTLAAAMAALEGK